MTKSYEGFQYCKRPMRRSESRVHGGRSCFSWFRTVKAAKSACHLTCWEEFDNNMMITKVYKSTGKKSHSAHHGAKSSPATLFKTYHVYSIYNISSKKWGPNSALCPLPIFHPPYRQTLPMPIPTAQKPALDVSHLSVPGPPAPRQQDKHGKTHHIRLMVQKRGEKTTWDGAKTL